MIARITFRWEECIMRGRVDWRREEWDVNGQHYMVWKSELELNRNIMLWFGLVTKTSEWGELLKAIKNGGWLRDRITHTLDSADSNNNIPSQDRQIAYQLIWSLVFYIDPCLNIIPNDGLHVNNAYMSV